MTELRRKRVAGTAAHILALTNMRDRVMTLEHLEQARRHVAEGERHIAHEREIIAEKERDGHDTSMSKQLLDQFEQICAM
jgi:hypothetical protein